ncbi:hypothetical protein K5I29_13240 [Flavobacterium agricola]|uniref:GLPGLI family protein n=1 Tax=Flavobacterium agricola TaxID=2870839 RepID=A0ABY6M333_9FLAO|nr:hypothetical protein [Flavobacterium agricola]UYW01373.1 hypothetical protein K5I29_13240 [Flavobacterium agricola]
MINKILQLAASIIIFSTAATAQVEAKYIGYRYKKDFSKKYYTLEFYIENNTKDTLFFSEKDIEYKVKNGETILKNKFNVTYLSKIYANLPPQRREFISDNEKKYRTKIYKTAHDRAVKVVEKNSHIFKNYSETRKSYAAGTIKSYIYVVPPNDFYVYRIYFDNEKLNHYSEVEVEYIKNDYFIGYKTEEYPEGLRLKW